MLAILSQTFDINDFGEPAEPAKSGFDSIPWGTIGHWALIIFLAIVVLNVFFGFFVIIRAEEHGVVFRFGKAIRELNPGLNFKLPFIDQVERVDMWITTMTLDDQELITKDSVSITVKAAAFYRITDARKNIVNVENASDTIQQLAQATMRRVIGGHKLEDILEHGQTVTDAIKSQLIAATEDLGITVSEVELLDIKLPANMQRAMSRVAEAEREAAAQLITAQGEENAAQALANAAEKLSLNPNAIELRRLATWREIGSDNATMIVVGGNSTAEMAAANTAAATRGALTSAAADAATPADAAPATDA